MVIATTSLFHAMLFGALGAPIADLGVRAVEWTIFISVFLDLAECRPSLVSEIVEDDLICRQCTFSWVWRELVSVSIGHDLVCDNSEIRT